MMVMPANSTGWFWHCLARETGVVGHLYSPRAQRGPWPWFPYALDNGAFSCWDQQANTFDDDKWEQTEQAWRELLFWTQTNEQRPLWGIVPDVPGNAERTLARYNNFVADLLDASIPPAIAVQDGMEVSDIYNLRVKPHVVCVGGSTEWKWSTVEQWADAFPRVHVLRCNSPEKLEYLRGLKTVISTDGTGWNRGDRKQTQGVEEFCVRYRSPHPCHHWMASYVSRATNKQQLSFA